MTLPLPFIGWFFTIVSILALVFGTMIVKTMRRSNPKGGILAGVSMNDLLLFVIWVVGLAGGVGVLQHRSWAPDVLVYFCYALIILTLFSMFNRFRDIKQQSAQKEVNWLGALVGLLLVTVPVVLLCYATIATLRSDAARAAFGP